MTSSDAPQPPGGPLRQDGADGGFAPDEQESGTSGAAGADGSDRERSRPGAKDRSAPEVKGDRPDQDPASADRQEENAETSEDQPSS